MKLAPGERDGAVRIWRPGKGTLPSRRRPWQAVAAAERAGLWVSVGSVEGVRRGTHESPTRESRDSQVVRESVGSPRFRACWTTPILALQALPVL